MSPHSATATHNEDLLVHFLSSNTMRGTSEVMLAPVVYPLGIGSGNTFQYVKVYIRDFQKPLSLHPVVGQRELRRGNAPKFQMLS